MSPGLVPSGSSEGEPSSLSLAACGLLTVSDAPCFVAASARSVPSPSQASPCVLALCPNIPFLHDGRRAQGVRLYPRTSLTTPARRLFSKQVPRAEALGVRASPNLGARIPATQRWHHCPHGQQAGRAVVEDRHLESDLPMYYLYPFLRVVMKSPGFPCVESLAQCLA